MKILAVDFSSSQRSVAVVADGAVSEVVHTGHGGSDALGMVEAVLNDAGLRRTQVEVLAVGLGPGSYTGIRAAIALAQGWQLAQGVALLGVSSIDIIVQDLRERGVQGGVGIAVDAQRGEFYLGQFKMSEGDCEPTNPLRIVSRDELQRCLAGGEKIYGPGMAALVPGTVDAYPRAAMLGKIARERSDFIPGEKLSPIYLREAAFVKAPPPRKFS